MNKEKLLLYSLSFMIISAQSLHAQAQVPTTTPQPYTPQPYYAQPYAQPSNTQPAAPYATQPNAYVPYDPNAQQVQPYPSVAQPSVFYPRVAIRDPNRIMYICSNTPNGYADCMPTDETMRTDIPNPDGNTYSCLATQGQFSDCYAWSTEILTPNNKVPEYVPEPMTVDPSSQSAETNETSSSLSINTTDILIESGIEAGLGILWGTSTFYWLKATQDTLYYYDDQGYSTYDHSTYLGKSYAISQASLLLLNTAIYGSAIASYEFYRYGTYPWEPYAGAAAGALITLLFGTMSGAINPEAEPWVTTVFGAIFPAAGALAANILLRKNKSSQTAQRSTFIMPTIAATPEAATVGIVGRF